MIKRFPLQFTEAEHRALKIAAAQSGESMNQFIRIALAEKIARQRMEQPAAAPDTLNAKDAEHSASGALAEAGKKPA